MKEEIIIKKYKLISIVLTLFLSFALLQVQQRNSQPPAADSIAVLPATFTPAQLYDYLSLFLISRDIERVGQIVAKLPLHVTVDFLHLLFEDKNAGIPVPQKIELVLHLIAYYPHRSAQYELLNIFSQKVGNILPFSPFAIAAQQQDNAALLLLIEWMQQQGTNIHFRKTAHSYIEHAYKYALANDDVKLFQKLLHFNISLSPALATQLLWYGVRDSKNITFIELLLQNGAHVNKGIAGRTPLMNAVENGNKEEAVLLLRYGADPRLVIDPEIGSALQIAIERNNLQLEGILRNFPVS